MPFEWISDPSAWVGLATLVILEIVLGIDNLVFIAILADRLPASQRRRARLVGLSLALLIRIGLLASIAWIVTLTTPLFTLLGVDFSGRDIILTVGGVFLLFKGTMELHERLEGSGGGGERSAGQAVFWQVIVQIVVLDAVFSLDSVITAVGMAQHLDVMIIAVIIAIGIMMWLSNPLMEFVSKHPTVVILCLGFLMMIGFSLIVEGFGFHVPKGYLYAAIGFSVLIEAFNQIGRRNRERFLTSGDLRERTADAVLKLLGGRRSELPLGGAADAIAEKAANEALFSAGEKDMIQGVLDLAERPAKSIMTPRTEIVWLDLDADSDTMRRAILHSPHARIPVARGSLDDFLGIAQVRDLLRDLVTTGAIDTAGSVVKPLLVHESLSALKVMEQLRHAPVQVAMVLDEYGALEGLITPTDILEAIAGEFPEDEADTALIERGADGSITLDGWIDIRQLSKLIERDLVDEAERYSTLAGFLLWRFGHFPEVGESIEDDGLTYTVIEADGRNIGRVRIAAPAADLLPS